VPENRSPLKGKPLRSPGQSLQEQRDDLVHDRLLGPLITALVLIILAGMEWIRYLAPAKPQPLFYSLVAFGGIAYAAIRWWRVWPELKSLRLAIDGERAVGQFLERLREDGYQVFHDVIGEGFNVDHIVIGPGGVFTVETKTRSKPARGDARIVFDGERILVAGIEPDRNPMVQAKAQAGWLRALLTESTGKKFSVRPVVVYPGWFVEQKAGATREFWVLEPKALPAFLAHEPVVLSPEDVKLASFHLSRFIRTQERGDKAK
jgi:nuclease-like protein